ncbi:MAG: HEPN domain-containing protein [Desulfosporosinus sp.]|nr:HEPN domain-containing protein [Desulfosporosinus sp.]
MTNTNILIKYNKFYDDLSSLIITAKEKVLSDDPEEFIENNVNFFNKSFMVMSCAYLESYLKEICFAVVNEVNSKLKIYAIPNNLIRWSIIKNKDKELKFQDFCLCITKHDIDDELSGNVAKTISTFAKVGIDLLNSTDFYTYKDTIGFVVTKRNNIIHHNDEASDLSFDDILIHIDIIKKYLNAIDYEVIKAFNIQ